MIRIEKHLSDTGVASRREAKRLIEEGFVLVNGKPTQPGDKIDPSKDRIDIKKQGLVSLDQKETVLVYKPRGYLSSKDVGAGKNIFDVFPQFAHLNTVGRLDKESEGLILLSNDGLVTKAITGRDHLIEKEYLVTVREKVTPAMVVKMSEGIRLEDGWTKPAIAKKVDAHSFSITLKEGRKHQIRRMANACHLTVESLKRTRIHTISAPGMLPGNFRILTDTEVQDIKSAGLPK